MGLGISIGISAVLSLVAFVSRPIYILYILTFIIVFFEEYGYGFTSFNASIFFNQEFVNFYNFKFIEIIIAFTYPVILITYKPKYDRPKLLFEKRLFIALVILIATLCFAEYAMKRTVTVSDWRLMVTGVIIFHMLSLLIDTEDKLLRYTKYLLIMLSIKAFIGLTMLAVGHGIESPRGPVPFFWDSRQVDAFAFGVIVISAYLINYEMLPARSRIFSKWIALIILAILAITILLSLRRTLWFVALGGGVIAFYTAKRITIAQMSILVFSLFVGMVLIMTLPVLEDFRERYGYYFQSMNILEKDIASQQHNATHIDNIKQYTKIILEEPEILLGGFRVRKGDEYLEFSAESGSEFQLGKAHNGLIRSILFYGIGGLIIYLLFYMSAIKRYWQVSQIKVPNHSTYICIGAIAFLAMQLLPSLFFVPPFYTSIKGNFYTLLALYLLRSSLYYATNNDVIKVEDRLSERRVKHETRILRYRDRSDQTSLTLWK
jgi:hypothetical protein